MLQNYNRNAESEKQNNSPFQLGNQEINIYITSISQKYMQFLDSILCKKIQNFRYCTYVSGSASYLGNLFCWLVRGSLFIELGCPEDLGKGWRGDLGTFMISRPR